jgi:hypothetical protein
MGILRLSLNGRTSFVFYVTEAVYESRAQKSSPTCGLCGRNLGVGYYYTCHACGAAYCYAHAPQKCDHAKARSSPIKVALRR